VTDYTKITDFAIKDTLLSGNPSKQAKGADVDAEFNAIAVAVATKENSADKDASGGYAGLTLFTINMKNVANTFTSYLTNSNTASRTYTLPDTTGTMGITTGTTGAFITPSGTTAQAPAGVVGYFRYDTTTDTLVVANNSGTYKTLADTSNTVLTTTDQTIAGVKTFSNVVKEAVGANIASASTVNLSTATGNTVHITGTTTITDVTMTSGQRMTVIFDGILTLTHHATTNSLPGAANITTAAGDRATYAYDGTTVYCVNYIRANGLGINMSAYTSLSGSSVQFSVPDGIRRLKMIVNAQSTNGVADIRVRIGHGSVETSGYAGTTYSIQGAVITTWSASAIFDNNTIAANSEHGYMQFDLVDASTDRWVITSLLGGSGAGSRIGTGSKVITGKLNIVDIVTTDTFDSGSVMATWEF
jgi:hypothetical protein